MTAYLDSPSGLVLPRSPNGSALSEAVTESLALIAFQEARIADLEARIQEEGWLRLGESGGKEFSRDALDKLTENARAHYLKNPLIRRAIEIGALYVFGQDLAVDAADDAVRLVVDRFWRENRAVLTGQQASRLTEVELQVTGNVFLALFPDRVTGSVRVRPVPMEEVRAIVGNPEDRAEVWWYHRTWKERQLGGGPDAEREALHPDWQHRPPDRPASVRVGDRDVDVRWDAPILHVRAGAFPHWRWGVSEVYAALDWAKAYKELLEDDATRSRALARFAWRLTTQGGAQGVAAAKARLQTTLGTPGAGGETNPPPVAGSTFVGDKSVGMDPIRIAGATLSPDHSRPARLMASAALGIPDHMFDSDVGNHATASTLDRPTELRFNERRAMWRDVLSDLLQWVIDADLAAARGLLTFTPDEEARAVELSWPDLLERSVTERVAAVREAATLNGQAPAGTIPAETLSRLLMGALGVEDIDAELKKLADELPPELPPEEDEDTDEPVEREQFVAALRDVREALRAGAR